MSGKVKKIPTIEVPSIFEEAESKASAVQRVEFTPEKDAVILLHRPRIGAKKFHKLYQEQYGKISDATILRRFQQLVDLGVTNLEEIQALHEEHSDAKYVTYTRR